MTLKPNFSTKLSNPERLKRIAAKLGYKQTRGPEKGQGSIRQLLEAISVGDVEIVKSKSSPPEISEQDKLNHILNELERRGLVSRPATRRGKLSPFNPIKIEGEPVSEMIIRERR